MHEEEDVRSIKDKKLNFQSPIFLSEEEQGTKKRFLLKQNDKMKLKWDFIIMAAAIYNCFTISFEIAFSPEAMKLFGFQLTNYLTDLAFVMDMIINFRVTFINETGDEINEPRAIAINYLRH
mmetsp:Transcript_14255/g.22202  ORF Transcript_14255/g.22202 Transcript_14255/m.22202 type:complete len:122 (+) Transcript_14255:883-1248(+)|eukprot:CAMPEP_0170485714 /NCGR_PEP_ID=MMETSP0208-20121228/4903_1 /TAXON_ID=197538 /ORGANISM="Strombidium inclinatum, Strain S3" /LENGTH=121 /DNA_ID=CAMNT_0010759435 /DNA_START=825 /DNA_END=1190 /DNA_ORIENTATION=+